MTDSMKIDSNYWKKGENKVKKCRLDKRAVKELHKEHAKNADIAALNTMADVIGKFAMDMVTYEMFECASIEEAERKQAELDKKNNPFKMVG